MSQEFLFTAAEVLAGRHAAGRLGNPAIPETVILTYGGSLLAYAARHHRLQRLAGLAGELGLLRSRAAPRQQVGVVGKFGVGAPAAVAVLEELASLGVQRLISIGLAGGLQYDLQPGEMVICRQAVRDDGVSNFYLPPEAPAMASPALADQLAGFLRASGIVFRSGSSWSIAAPYRERRDHAAVLRQAGVLTIDMEAAGLFAAGQALGVQCLAVFTVADTLRPGLSGDAWQLGLMQERPGRQLERLFDVIVAYATR